MPRWCLAAPRQRTKRRKTSSSLGGDLQNHRFVALPQGPPILPPVRYHWYSFRRTSLGFVDISDSATASSARQPPRPCWPHEVGSFGRPLHDDPELYDCCGPAMWAGCDDGLGGGVGPLLAQSSFGRLGKG